MAEKIEILIVDDHPVIGMAMNLLLTTEMRNANVERADGGKPALKMLKEKAYDLIILDVNLPDYNILTLIPNIFNAQPDSKILIFTMSPENILARRLFSMDIQGFLTKNSPDEEIMKAIRTVLEGGKYVSEEFSSQVVSDFLSGKKNVNPFDELSEREYQILLELLKGESTRNIADKLHLHGSSVSTYRLRIYDKVDVDNHIDLYKKARLFGLVD